MGRAIRLIAGRIHDRRRAMTHDFTVPLQLLEIGTLLSASFLARTRNPMEGDFDPHVVIPALVLVAVSAQRCAFSNRSEDDAVRHDSALSSTFETRLLATFAELAFIHLLSHVIRRPDVDRVGWHVEPAAAIEFRRLANGLRRSVSRRTRSADGEGWGGIIGLTCMTAHWATFIPIWVGGIAMASLPA